MSKPNASKAPVDAKVSAPAADEWDTVDTAGPEIWRGESEGDCVTGTLSSKRTIDMGEGKSFTIYVLDTPAGPHGLSGAYLTRALASVKRNATVRITFTGMKDVGKGKNPMREYDVKVKKGTGEAAPIG